MNKIKQVANQYLKKCAAPVDKQSQRKAKDEKTIDESEEEAEDGYKPRKMIQMGK